MSDITTHILNDLAVRRMVAVGRGDKDQVCRIDEDFRETRELLGQPAVRVILGAQPGETLTT